MPKARSGANNVIISNRGKLGGRGHLICPLSRTLPIYYFEQWGILDLSCTSVHSCGTFQNLENLPFLEIIFTEMSQKLYIPGSYYYWVGNFSYSIFILAGCGQQEWVLLVGYILPLLDIMIIIGSSRLIILLIPNADISERQNFGQMCLIMAKFTHC